MKVAVEPCHDDFYDLQQQFFERQAQAVTKLRSFDPAPFEYAGDPHEPGGLLGEITNWILATSFQPNRPLALAAAVAVVGTVASRHLGGPTRAAMHLYIACIGQTAIGKDRPLSAAEQILSAAGLGSVATSGKFKSDTAIELLLSDSPAALAIIDEIGAHLFAKMKNFRASSHETAIGSALRELWSREFVPYNTSARAGMKATKIESPALTILGASTKDEFYTSLAGANIDNGFANRFLVIPAAPRAKGRSPEKDPARVPAHIVSQLQTILPPSTGNLSGGASALVSKIAPAVQFLTWEDDHARELFERLSDDVLRWADSDANASPFLGRTAHIAIRLAAIRAVGRKGRDATVTVDDVKWGATLALRSARVWIDDVAQHMSSNETQAQYKLVLRIVSEAGGNGINKGDILKRLNGRIQRNALDGILTQLVEAGSIKDISPPKPAGGRPTVRYAVV